MEELGNLPTDQLLILAGLVVVLLVLLFVLGRALKLTTALFKLGCIVILVLVAMVFIALWAMGG